MFSEHFINIVMGSTAWSREWFRYHASERFFVIIMDCDSLTHESLSARSARSEYQQQQQPQPTDMRLMFKFDVENIQNI